MRKAPAALALVNARRFLMATAPRWCARSVVRRRDVGAARRPNLLIVIKVILLISGRLVKLELFLRAVIVDDAVPQE